MKTTRIVKKSIALLLVLLLCASMASAASSDDKGFTYRNSLEGYKNKFIFKTPIVLNYIPLSGKSLTFEYIHYISEDTTFTLTNTSTNNEYYIDVDILFYTQSSKGNYELNAWAENLLNGCGDGILKSGDTATFTQGFLMNSASWKDLLPDVKMEDVLFVTMIKKCYPGGKITGHLYGYCVDNEIVKTLEKSDSSSSSDAPFSDVPKNAYYHDAVLWALEKKITTGTSETTFSPAETCTRGQVATFLWRASGCPEPKTKDNPFRDVKESDYFYKAVLWAYENEITTGTSETTFDPEGTCTSAHVITFLWRANGKPSSDHSGTEYYAEAVAWANKNKLLDGTDTPFAPENLSPRADIVTYLYRVMAK